MANNAVLKYMRFAYEGQDYMISIQERDVREIRRLYNMMRSLIGGNVPVQNYLTLKGKPYFEYENNVYTVVRHYDEIKEIDETQLGKNLGLLHSHKGQRLHNRRIYSIIQKEYKLIRYYKDLIGFKRDRKDIDDLMMKLIELNEDNLEEANTVLSDSSVIRNIDTYLDNNHINHNGLRKGGLLIAPKIGLCFSTMDSSVNGTPMEDVADVILQLLERQMDINRVKEFLDSYEKRFSISKEDAQVLASLLRYPRRLLTILNDYTMHRSIQINALKDYILDIPIKNKAIASINKYISS